MTARVADNGPGPAKVAEPASPPHAARTVINIFRIYPTKMSGRKLYLRLLKAIYRYD